MEANVEQAFGELLNVVAIVLPVLYSFVIARETWQKAVAVVLALLFVAGLVGLKYQCNPAKQVNHLYNYGEEVR
jgi:RsiW-degrading membrane proteinase PrsW (M82 family)